MALKYIGRYSTQSWKLFEQHYTAPIYHCSMNEYMCVPTRIHNTKTGPQQIIMSPKPSTHNTGDTWQGNAHGELMSLKRAVC